jgi:hypothetical protein
MTQSQRTAVPRWLNWKLLEDLSTRLGTQSLLEWIEEKTAALAREGWSTESGRVELTSRLLGKAGIKSVSLDPRCTGFAEMRASRPGQYEVSIRAFRTAVNRRFSLAHEVAHTFWFEPNTAARPLSKWQSILADDPTIEWLCNRAAAALLVPRGLLERSLSYHKATLLDDQPKLHLLWDLAAQYGVPIQMLARRWLHDLAVRYLALVSLKPFTDDAKSSSGMMISWSAELDARSTRSRSLYGRSIPPHAIPQCDKGATQKVFLDARWAAFLAQARSLERARAFKDLPAGGQVPGLVARPRDLVSQEVMIAFHTPANGTNR